MTRRILLLIALFVLNVADVATTFYGLSIGGKELNPLFRLQRLDVKISLPFIYGLFWLVSYALCERHGFKRGLSILNINLVLVTLIYALVVINNIIGILSVKL